MEIENENKNNPSQIPKVPRIRTFKDDLARAEANPSEATPPPPPPAPKPVHLMPPSPIPTPPNAQPGDSNLPPPPPPPPKPEISPGNPFVQYHGLDSFDPSQNIRKPGYKISPIRTYTGDVSNVVQSGNTSIVDIAVAEQKSREEKAQEEAAEKFETKKSFFMILMSILFIALGAGVFYYFIFFKKSEETPIAVVEPKLIQQELEQKIAFSTNREKLIRELGEVLEASVPPSSLKVIFIEDETTEKQVVAPEFLSVIGESIPQFLARSFKDDFIAGVYSNQKNRPFFILQVDSFENVFAGMLSWEENMKQDLGELFLSNEDRGIFGIVGSTTPPQNFEDLVVKNQDTRVLKNSQGENILLYSFPNKNILIITTDANTLIELIDRLRKSQILR